jgi:hypothetical protein
MRASETPAATVHDCGGPFAFDWALEHVERVQHLVVVTTWMWSFLDEARMAKRARLVQRGPFRLLYRHLNASLNLIMPSAYGHAHEPPPRSPHACAHRW